MVQSLTDCVFTNDDLFFDKYNSGCHCNGCIVS